MYIDKDLFVKYNLPGMLVPSATNTIAVTASFIPKVPPKCEAMSPMTAVTTPMQNIDTTKHRYPLSISERQNQNVHNLHPLIRLKKFDFKI